MIKVTAADGHILDAYLARPTRAARGAIVVAQEMYGVNDYLRAVCGFYAARGYLAIAPALYDRRHRDLVYDYSPEDHDKAQVTYKSWPIEAALDDLDAARATVAQAGKVGIIGFCWGGSLAWLAACRRNYDAAVAYYGSMMPDFARERPRCPVMAHVGDKDTSLPPPRVAEFRAAQPSVPVFIYPGAQHGFDNEGRTARYHEEAHRLARVRTLGFLAAHIG